MSERSEFAQRNQMTTIRPNNNKPPREERGGDGREDRVGEEVRHPSWWAERWERGMW